MDRIVIATNDLHLSLYRGFLMGEQDGDEVGRTALDDVHVVVLHALVTWSSTIVSALAERGAPIVFCGGNHMSVAVTLPLERHHAQGARMQAQWSASRPLAKQPWRRVVTAKIATQGSLLEARAKMAMQPFRIWPRASNRVTPAMSRRRQLGVTGHC